jgi:hypothetical protein
MAYTWSLERGVYLDADGDVVPARVLRAALRTVIEDSADRLGILAERFADGRLELLAWRAASQAELKVAHGLATTLAHGGLRQLDASTRGYLGAQLRQQYDFLSGFALDMLTGERPSTEAIVARARSYAGSAHSTFEGVRRRDARGRGVTLERNVLEPGSAHCAGCEAATGEGWVPLGTLSLPGSRDCLSQCRCELEQRAPEAVGA